MLLPVIFLLAQAAPVAWSSARPPECAALDTGRASNVWERAKAPELRRYCDLLASGAAKLAGGEGGKDEVIALADKAEKIMPGHAAPPVLKGRALAQASRWQDALAALRDAKSRDERALDDPLALYVWARVLARTGQLDDARTAYRALLPRASMLTLADRSSASFEAGMLAMARGPAGLDEAVPILRQAVRDSQDVAQLASVLALALALDRAGLGDQARALLGERVHGDPRPDLESVAGRALLPPTVAAEEHALAALALESSDPNAAHAEWDAYVKAAGDGAWGDHARAHLAPRRGR
jgi:tetratricopeptide (TPR) repeat protein